MDKAAKFNPGRLFTTSKLVKISMLGVMSFLIMFIEFPIMFFPEFLKSVPHSKRISDKRAFKKVVDKRLK